MVLSTRGSSDIIVLFLVLSSLYFLLTKRFVLGGVFYGLGVHFKIYPIIFALPLWLFIDRTYKVKSWAALYNPRVIFSLN